MPEPAERRPSVTPETRAIRRIQQAGTDAELALARRMAMNPSDLAALNHLSMTDRSIGPQELSVRLGISPAATTELVDRLERAGHVVRHRDLVDRRRVRLVPSEGATTEVLGRLGALFAALDALTVDRSSEERKLLQGYLDDVAATLERFSADA